MSTSPPPHGGHILEVSATVESIDKKDASAVVVLSSENLQVLWHCKPEDADQYQVGQKFQIWAFPA